MAEISVASNPWKASRRNSSSSPFASSSSRSLGRNSLELDVVVSRHAASGHPKIKFTTAASEDGEK